jgi:hypothetical protein
MPQVPVPKVVENPERLATLKLTDIVELLPAAFVVVDQEPPLGNAKNPAILVVVEKVPDAI